MTNLGKRIKQVRLGLALTQSEFAQILSVEAVTVSRWERGVSEPGLRNLRKLAKLARSPVNKFIEETAS